MQPQLKFLSERNLIGTRMTMTFAHNKTAELWKTFMPRRHEITNNVDTLLYSMQIYSPSFFDAFNPNKEFEKWATMEVTNFTTIPQGMETFILPSGLYAVFLYQGNETQAEETFRFILGIWLPNSEYVLDSRPHFEVLGEKYNQGNPDSEEEIWIPIKLKS